MKSISKVAILVVFALAFAAVSIAIVNATNKNDDFVDFEVAEIEAKDNEMTISDDAEKSFAETEEISVDSEKETVFDSEYFAKYWPKDFGSYAFLDVDTIEITSIIEINCIYDNSLFGYLIDARDGNGNCANMVVTVADGVPMSFECRQSDYYTTEIPLDSIRYFYYAYPDLWGLNEDGLFINLATGETKEPSEIKYYKQKETRRIVEHFVNGKLVEREIDGVKEELDENSKPYTDDMFYEYVDILPYYIDEN